MPKDQHRDWYDVAFDALYAEVYAHRDDREAHRLVQALADRFPLSGPVLDIACGHGRLLEPLRRAFHSVIGIDRSWVLLQQARARPGAGALCRGDMRELPFAGGRFGSAVSLFTSFGYFATIDEDRAVLRETARILQSRGRFVLDYLNPAPTVEHLIPSSRRQVGHRLVEERRWVDPEGPFLRKEVSVTQEGTQPVVYQERVRLYSPSELIGVCKSAGLAVCEVWGDYDGGPHDPGSSPRMIVLAARMETAR